MEMVMKKDKSSELEPEVRLSIAWRFCIQVAHVWIKVGHFRFFLSLFLILFFSLIRIEIRDHL